MKIQIPNSFMGVNGEEALERILKKEPRVPQPTPITAPAPSRDVPKIYYSGSKNAWKLFLSRVTC